MNSKMTTNSQVLTTTPKTKTKTNYASKQVEQEHNHRNGDPMEGYKWGRGGGEWGKRYRE